MKRLFVAIPAIFMSLGVMAGSYKVDSAHSEVGFEVSHLVVAKAKGNFKKFSGTFDLDPNSRVISNIDITVDVKSVDTGEPDRDKHLVGEDFFHAEKFPTARFMVKNRVKLGKKASKKISGALEIRGVKKNVSFDVDYKGNVKDPWGNEKAIFEASTTIDRKEFNIKWNKALDKGGALVGNKVKLVINLQGSPVKKGKKVSQN